MSLTPTRADLAGKSDEKLEKKDGNPRGVETKMYRKMKSVSRAAARRALSYQKNACLKLSVGYAPKVPYMRLAILLARRKY